MNNNQKEKFIELYCGASKTYDGMARKHFDQEMDLIDRKKENAAAVIEQAKIDKKWATDFLKEIEIEEL